MGRFAGHNVVADLFGRPMIPLRIDWYVTVLDLGTWGALYTVGWDRQLLSSGQNTKVIKQTINHKRIYPPRRGTREDTLAAAVPIVQAPPQYPAGGRHLRVSYIGGSGAPAKLCQSPNSCASAKTAALSSRGPRVTRAPIKFSLSRVLATSRPSRPGRLLAARQSRASGGCARYKRGTSLSEHSDAELQLVERRPCWQSSSDGVGMTPPKFDGAPKPTSSVMISRMLEASLGRTTPPATRVWTLAEGGFRGSCGEGGG